VSVRIIFQGISATSAIHALEGKGMLLMHVSDERETASFAG